MKRTAEFVLGLIGGIFGFIGAIIALTVGGLGGAFGAEGALTITTLGWFAMLFSVIGIVGASLVNSWTIGAGIFMLVSAVGGLICISFFYILPFILLVIAGLMALLRKEKKK